MTNRLFLYYPDGHEIHRESQHPERPERIEAIRNELTVQGWWSTSTVVDPVELNGAVLHNVHDPEYLSDLKKTCMRGQWYDQDTYLVPESYELALQTAGGAASLAYKVWSTESSAGFALCRPPGHHATQDRAMGFCLVNNAAVAAEYLLQNTPAKKLAILDFDLHHGNGTQDILWRRGDILYLSTHQWPLYPGTGRLEETGAGQGEFATANLPLPPGTGDEGFFSCMDEFILPVLDRYAPEMLLISIGFDAHWKDPLGFLQLSGAGYGKLISQLKAWAQESCRGRIALILEGGYNLDAVTTCARTSVAALMGYPIVDDIGRSPHADTTRWRVVLDQARSIWQI